MVKVFKMPGIIQIQGGDYHGEENKEMKREGASITHKFSFLSGRYRNDCHYPYFYGCLKKCHQNACIYVHMLIQIKISNDFFNVPFQGFGSFN